MTSRRDLLCDCAISVLAAEGGRGLTHRAVDRAAGVPEGTTKNYFPSRDALLGAAADRMDASGCQSALVVDASGHLQGRATVADLRRHGALGPATRPCARLHASATVKQALPVVAAEAEPVAVVDDDELLQGTLDRAGVVNALARRAHAAQPAALEMAAS